MVTQELRIWDGVVNSIAVKWYKLVDPVLGPLFGGIDNAANFLLESLKCDRIYFFPEVSLAVIIILVFFLSAIGGGSESFQVKVVRWLYRFLLIVWAVWGWTILTVLEGVGTVEEGIIVNAGSLHVNFELFVLKGIVFTCFLILLGFYKITFEQQFYSRILLEQFGLSCIMVFFGFLMVSADHLILLGLSLTGLNVSCYVLLGQTKTQTAIESAIKYFIVGMLALFYFFLGCWFVWVEFGTLSLSQLAAGGYTATYLSIFGIFLTAVALTIKLSTFPNHNWAVDVYDGASNYLMCLLVVVAKTLSFVALANIINSVSATFMDVLSPMVQFIAVLSMVVGTFGAIRQQRVRRFLTYSSINHMGFLLLLLVSVDYGQMFWVWFYLFFYLVGSVIFFSILVGIRKTNGRELGYLTELATLQYIRPEVALLLFISLFSFAGIPPFMGFFSKYVVMFFSYSALNYVSLLVIFMLMGFAAYNYLRAIKNMYFRLNFLPTVHFYYLWPTFGVGFLWYLAFFLLGPWAIYLYKYLLLV